MRKIDSVAVVALLGVALLGCGAMKKTKECNAFIEKVNAGVKDVETATKDDKDPEASMTKVAEVYDKISTDIAGLSVETPDLKKDATEYQDMCKKAAKAARQVASALKTTNLSEAESAQKDFAEIVKQEETLVTKINGYCQSP